VTKIGVVVDEEYCVDSVIGGFIVCFVSIGFFVVDVSVAKLIIAELAVVVEIFYIIVTTDCFVVSGIVYEGILDATNAVVSTVVNFIHVFVCEFWDVMCNFDVV